MKRYIYTSTRVDIPDIPHSELQPNYSRAVNYFAGVVPEGNYRQQLKYLTPELETVVIKDLYTDQYTNRVKDIYAMLVSAVNGETLDTSTAKVIEVDNKQILLDGNTRLAALSLLGHKTAKVLVYR